MDKKYKDKAHELIDEIDAKINEWEEKLNKKSESTGEDIEQKIENLKAKRKDLKEDLKKFVDVSDERWREIEQDMESKFKDLKDVYHYLKVKWSK